MNYFSGVFSEGDGSPTTGWSEPLGSGWLSFFRWAAVSLRAIHSARSRWGILIPSRLRCIPCGRSWWMSRLQTSLAVAAQPSAEANSVLPAHRALPAIVWPSSWFSQFPPAVAWLHVLRFGFCELGFAGAAMVVV